MQKLVETDPNHTHMFSGCLLKWPSIMYYILAKKKFFLSKTQDMVDINTQYMTNSTLVSPVKIEYVTKNNIFGLKMMMKSGLEKNILKFLHAQAIFY